MVALLNVIKRIMAYISVGQIAFNLTFFLQTITMDKLGSYFSYTRQRNPFFLGQVLRILPF